MVDRRIDAERSRQVNDRTRALRRAALQAAMAPSIYNTQPWLLQLRPSSLQLNADPNRWLPSLDRQARQLTLSVGCALFNARTAIAAARLQAVVDRSTDSVPAQLTATLTARADGPGDPAHAELNKYINSSPPTSAATPAHDSSLLQRLSRACSAGGTSFVALTAPQYRELLTDLTREASAAITASDARPAGQWVRAFGPTIWSNARTRFDGDVLPALVCAPGDTPLHWLDAGESLQRVLLEVARFGYSAQIYTTPIESPDIRSRLRDGVLTTDFPQALVVIGPARVPFRPLRRHLSDILCHKG